jgi:WD40 repeat protein
MGTSAATPLELWDLIAGKRLAFWNQDSYVMDLDRRYDFEAWKCCQFSPDGKRVATGSNLGLKIWDVSQGKVEKAIGYNHAIDQLAFSQDGSRILAVMSGNQEDRVQTAGGVDMTCCWAAVFSVDTGAELRSWEAFRRDGDWRSAALSPDGQWVVSGSSQGQIRLWHVTTGQELAHWEGHEAGVTALCFHPDGQTLVSGARDGTLKLWSLPYIRKGLAALNLSW